MTDPFRDRTEAAIERAERLADENDDLREEVERLRGEKLRIAETPPDASASPPDSLADKTLAHLQELADERDTSGVPRIAPIADPLKKPASRTITEASAKVLEAKPGKRPLDVPALPPSDLARDRERRAARRGFLTGLFVAAVVLLPIIIALATAR